MLSKGYDADRRSDKALINTGAGTHKNAARRESLSMVSDADTL
jgi:hypothetical protein